MIPKNAFNEWLETEHGKLSMQPYDFTKPGQLQYLENRLWWAYTAGMDSVAQTPDGWVSVEDADIKDELPYLCFSPSYKQGEVLRHRILQGQFIRMCKDVTHIQQLSTP